MAILAVAIMATLLPQKVVVAGVDPSTVLIALTWIGGLLLIRRAAKGLPWRQTSAGDFPDAAARKRGKTEKDKRPFGIAVVIFGAGAIVRTEDFELAVSDIFGGNAFLPVLFLPATLLAGASVLGRAAKTDVFMAALGILLTAVYVFGLIFRPQKQYLRLGPDSIAVLVLYLAGIAGLIVIDHG